MAEPKYRPRHHLPTDGYEAMVAVAGFTQLAQAVTAPATAAVANYAVANARTQRVAIIHDSGTYGDIRYRYSAVNDTAVDATAASWPLLADVYHVMDAGYGDQLSFYNASAAAVTVNLMELA
jgi:hypothetical protein